MESLCESLLTPYSFRTRFGPHTSRHNLATQADVIHSEAQAHEFRSKKLTENPDNGASLTGSLTLSSHLNDNGHTHRNMSKKKRARPNPLPPRAWMENEDADLAKGYQKYGFQWSLIARDPTLTFLNRTGAHIRDRFRLKFPDVYRNVSRIQRDALAEAKALKEKEKEKEAENVTTNGNEGPTDLVEHAQSHDDNGSYDSIHGQALSNPVTRQSLSAIAPFNIMGLLNDDEEDIRLSSFRYDDWDENVTLPPLLWEDMATRPMFDLE